MRLHPRRLYAIFFVAVSLGLSSLTAPVARPRTMNVLDYYLAMPQKYMRYAGGESEQARNAALYVSDVEKGYLQARQPNGEFYTSLALFKRPDGSDLIAVENRECARGCNEEFYLLTYRDGRWSDVTAQVLPAVDNTVVRAELDKKFKARESFQPHVLHRLSTGGGPVDVGEYWSGVSLGQLEWINGEFVFKPLGESAHSTRNVLASVSNEQGDRLELVSIDPDLSNHLPLKGRLNVRIAYELHSARAVHIWTRPVVLEQRLPDEFTHPSMPYLQGSGELTTWFGFDNQAHLQQFRVDMIDDEKKKPLLTLNYNVDTDWEGVLECPTFFVECFPHNNSPKAPLACMVYPSGVRPDQNLTYEWDVSGGTITSGQGTRRIILNTDGTQARELTATVTVGGLPAKCATKAAYSAPLGAPGK
jgi:hypothetical protein